MSLLKRYKWHDEESHQSFNVNDEYDALIISSKNKTTKIGRYSRRTRTLHLNFKTPYDIPTLHAGKVTVTVEKWLTDIPCVRRFVCHFYHESGESLERRVSDRKMRRYFKKCPPNFSHGIRSVYFTWSRRHATDFDGRDSEVYDQILEDAKDSNKKRKQGE